MYYSTHVACCLVLVPCCQVVGEADREEHPSVWHAGGSGQSGSSDCSERREERLGLQQTLGEGLPGQCKIHTWTKHKQNKVWVLLSSSNMYFHVPPHIMLKVLNYTWYLLHQNQSPVDPDRSLSFQLPAFLLYLFINLRAATLTMSIRDLNIIFLISS